MGSLPYLPTYHYFNHFPLRDGLFSFFHTYLLRTLHSPTNGRYPQPNLQSWAGTKGGFRSKRRPTLVRMAAAWGSGITGSGLSSPFPLLRSTQSRSDRAENFEANTHPYRIPPLLFLHIHSTSHSTNTGVYRHYHSTVICLCRPPHEGAVGRGPGPSPIVNYCFCIPRGTTA